MKKIIAVAALSIATGTAFAQTANFTGFSAVVNLNTVAVNTKVSLEELASFDGIGQQSWGASIQGAYGFELSNSSVLSVGATYGLSKSKAGSLTVEGEDGGTAALKLKNQMSIYVEPGFLLSDKTMVYGKVAYESGKGTADFTGGDSESQKIKGSSFGFGIRTMIDKNTFIQAEIKQVGYKAKEYESFGSIKTKATVGTIGFGMKF